MFSKNKLSVKNILLIISFAEIVAGIFSDSFSLSALGLFSILHFYDYSFAKAAKNKNAGIVIKILISVFLLYLFFVSFIESIETFGYYKNVPQVWIFPVIAVLFFLRLSLRTVYEEVNFFPVIQIFLYLIALICIVLSCFFENYFEPVFTVALLSCEIYLFCLNIKL